MKKLISYSLFDDMQKYVPKDTITDIYPEGFEVGDRTDSTIVTFLRNYYDSHMPVDVTAWFRVNKPSDTLIYANELAPQVIFVRDTLCSIFSDLLEEDEHNPTMVIGSHKSKSVRLPVYRIYLKKYNIEIILRCNFYNWIISINSSRPLKFDNLRLFNKDLRVGPQYCEGFPKDKIYGSYSDDQSKFTFELDSKYEVFTYFYLLNHYLR